MRRNKEGDFSLVRPGLFYVVENNWQSESF